MIPELRELLQLDSLELDYKVSICDFDGENFTYNIRTEDGEVSKIYSKVDDCIRDIAEGDDYIGYIDLTEYDDYISIYHDTGSVDDGLAAVHKVLNAINEVSGVKSVVINE